MFHCAEEVVGGDRTIAIVATFRTGFRTNRLHLQWLHVALRPLIALNLSAGICLGGGLR
jgi:hypothetical protein